MRVFDVLATSDADLEPIRRWFTIRYPDAATDAATDLVETLDEHAITALANLMDVPAAQCRDRLIDLGNQ